MPPKRKKSSSKKSASKKSGSNTTTTGTQTKKASKGAVSKLLKDWYETREDMKEAERHLAYLKKQATKMMDSNSVNTLKSKNYTLQRRKNSRMSLKRDDLPEDVWQKYSSKTQYKSFSISEN